MTDEVGKVEVEVKAAGEALKSDAIQATEQATAAASSAAAEVKTDAQKIAEMTHAEHLSFSAALHARLLAVEEWLKAHL